MTQLTLCKAIVIIYFMLAVVGVMAHPCPIGGTKDITIRDKSNCYTHCIQTTGQCFTRCY